MLPYSGLSHVDKRRWINAHLSVQSSLEIMKACLHSWRIRPRGKWFPEHNRTLWMWVTMKKRIPNSGLIIRSVVNLWMATEMCIVIGSTKAAIHLFYSTCINHGSRLLLKPLFSIFFLIVLLIQTLPLTQARIVTPLRVFQKASQLQEENITQQKLGLNNNLEIHKTDIMY